MEPIPEDRELPPSARTVASKSLLREVYTSEQVDTIVRTVPQSSVPESWDFVDQPVDPEMASYYVTEPLGPSNARGSTYQYSYESHYDEPPGEDGDVYDATDYVHYADPTVSTNEDPNIERHSTQTQKVTRVTKVTTTRSVRQMPVAGEGTDGYYFDPDGNAIPIAGDRPAGANYETVTYSQNGIVALEHQMENTSLRQPPHGASYDDQVTAYATPGPPGAPQVVDVDTTQVTLVWLRPDYEGDAGPVEGYQVQVKRPQDPHWQPAHAGFIAETQCTISNLAPNGENQFRVLAKNAAGLGQSSTPSPLVQLRPRYDNVGGGHHAVSDRPGVPYPPGRPQVVAVDGDRALIVWDPPVVQTSIAPTAGYQVEYRVSGTTNWVASNDFLISECRHEVLGLRPNGDYEFRVLARNADGLSEPSASSGLVRIKPPAPKRTSRSNIPTNLLLPPSQPQVMDADSDWVTLLWAPPTVPGRYGPSDQVIGYIVESREIGDPNWYSASDRLISSTQLTVRNLRPNSTYEFRVFAKTADGVSEASEVSDLVQLRPKINAPPRGVPARPQAPEIMDYVGDQVTLCWLPAHSSLPVQGYDVEFRDFAQDADWYKVNDLLMQTCKMTIGDLLEGHDYEFRVIAKNAMGYSEPSDASPPILIGPRNGMEPVHRVDLTNGQQSGNNEQLQDEMVRESPPIPDRDDSPPPIHRPPFSGQDGLHWRDPTLREVLDYLSNPNPMIQLNASGYLQHLTYHDNDVKEQTRELGGIRKLVDLLSSEVPEIQKNACGCLKNISYGKENDQNKRAIRDAGGIPALASLLRKTPDMQVKEELTGAVWNLSSYDDVKRPILEVASDALVRQVIVPGSGWSPDGNYDPNRQYNPNVFRNGTGILRNVSAATDTARRMLRDTPNLIESLVHYLHLAVMQRNEADTRTVENVVCILRNLSYRVQEIEDPNYDPNASTLNSSRDGNSTDRSKSAPSGSPKNLKKKESKLFKKKDKGEQMATSPGRGVYNGGSGGPVRGAQLLWQPELVKLYLKLLQEASNSDTLEASAGALQNLAACSFEPSAEVRATVRKEKGLPILVELLRLQEDKVVCAVTTALRNLSLDQRNRELIGKYAMKDLVNKLPSPQQRERDRHVSDATIGAVLGVLFETVRSSADFTRNLHECGGTDRLRYLARAYPQYGTRVCKYASQVLYVMWQHKELHDGFKRAGLKESDFYSGQASRGQSTTLARPISTQGPERPHGLRPDLDDSGSTRYGAMGSTSSIPQRHSRGPSQRQSESLPMTPTSTNGRDRPEQRKPRPPQSHQYAPHAPPHYDTVSSGEPLYAQVQKRNGAQNGQKTAVGGDSWV